MMTLGTNWPLWQITLSRVRELVRQPEALFWVFVAPILMTCILGIAFRATEPPPLAIGVQTGPGAKAIAASLAGERFDTEVLSGEEASRRLRSGDLDLVVLPGERVTYWYDPTRAEARHAAALADSAIQSAAGRTDARETTIRELREPGSRYVDFLVPGLLGMNLMGTGLWGIGFAIVNARSKLFLKRLVVTPMRRSHFLLGQMFGRLIFLIPEVAVIVLFARLVFGVPNYGAWLDLALVCVLGALAFTGLGLLVASRTRTIEGVSGLMNVIMLPMWICSGVFFSTSKFPDFAQPLIQALPLTALNDALRGIMLDGSSLLAQGGELAIVAAWTVGSFVLALAIFRWT